VVVAGVGVEPTKKRLWNVPWHRSTPCLCCGAGSWTRSV